MESVKLSCRQVLTKLQKEISMENEDVKKDNRGNKGDKSAPYKRQQRLRHLANAATAANLLQSGFLTQEQAETAKERIRTEEQRLWQN